ncbi:MAG: cell division protein FtsA [Armatimonadetes bacterium]|nr:cell division protein FtsA [Armatimonadota bacterium]
MNAVPLIVGLDIGTTKVCTVVGALTDDHQIDIRGVGLTRSAGLRRGVIVDLEKTIEAVRQSQEDAQRMAGVPLTGAHVYVGVTGDHVDSFNCTGAVEIHRPNDEILASDVDRARAAAANGVQTAERDIILERPREFIVDGQVGISDPVHMTGRRLEVVLHVVTGEHRFLNEIRHCVERAGLGVDSLVLEAVATGEAITSREERELGCCVLDIGGGTTDLALYLDGHLAHTSAIPVGGAHVTYDLSYGLEVPYPLAEELKREYACASVELCDPDLLIPYRNVRHEECRAEQRFLAEIVGPRMEELFELVLADLARVKVDPRQLGAGIVLSGGASRLRGTLSVAREVLQVVVREGQPQQVVGHTERVAGPQFSTAVGLVRVGGMDQARKLQQIEETSFWGRMRTYWRNFTRLFD